MTLNEKIEKAQTLKTIKDNKLEKKAQLEADIATVDAELDTLLDDILKSMLEQHLEEVHTASGIVAQYFAKNEFSYGDEKALLQYLINNNMNKYIVTKTTQSLNKKDLKKDLKDNQELKESLSTFVGDKKTEYVVVTTEDNHKRMLEHIEEGAKK